MIAALVFLVRSGRGRIGLFLVGAFVFVAVFGRWLAPYNPQSFDAGAIRLTGNVTGSPPFHGALRHHGWRAAAVRLPPVPSGHDARILAPAEVEL